MVFPVRCFTCGKVVGAKENTYKTHLENGVEPKIALDAIGMTRYCCRRMFLSYINIIDKVNLFPEHKDRVPEQKNSPREN